MKLGSVRLAADDFHAATVLLEHKPAVWESKISCNIQELCEWEENPSSTQELPPNQFDSLMEVYK